MWSIQLRRTIPLSLHMNWTTKSMFFSSYLSGVSRTKDSGTSMFLISPMTWGTTVPSAFALRAVHRCCATPRICGLFAAAVLPHEVLACSWLCSFTRCGSALVLSFRFTCAFLGVTSCSRRALFLHVSRFATLRFEQCPLSLPVAAYPVRLSRSASAELTPPVQCEALVASRSWLSRRAAPSSTC